MKYQDTIEYLYGLQKQGMKFGLDNMQWLMSATGFPQKNFLSVHIAGTNGKGSTAAMIDSILRTAGLRTGLFTSPHLVSFTERIRVNGEEISEAEVVRLAEEVRNIAEKREDVSPTFFEVVTTMAFLHFRNLHVDWVVIETGLGGRLDATNVITPEVTVITRIGFDHCEFLGNTLSEIAAEKAGVLKAGIPLVTANQGDEVLAVLRDHAAAKGSPVYVYDKDYFADEVSGSADGISCNYRGNEEYQGLKVPLEGMHQAVNTAMALKTVELIQERHPSLRFDLRKGLETVRWQGRLEMVMEEPAILIDGAHNPQAAEVLSVYLKKLVPERHDRIILIAGVMGDKDIPGILCPLLPVASEIIFTAPAYGRAASPELLASHAASAGYPSRTAPTVAEALAMAEGLFREGDIIVVTGSFYTIGEAKEILRGKGVLSRLRE